MSYREVMDLPIRAFWLMNSNVGRLLAEKDLRELTLQAARHGGEQREQIRQHLLIEQGDTGKLKQQQQHPLQDAERDQDGFEELKALAALM